MKKFSISLLALFALGVMGTATFDQTKDWPEEDEYLAFEYDEEDEYLVSCEGGKCPREMVERLRREKREERARKNGKYYNENEEQEKQFLVLCK